MIPVETVPGIRGKAWGRAVAQGNVVWIISYTVRTLVNARITMYPHLTQQ
jgi:hypothetical protein